MEIVCECGHSDVNHSDLDLFELSDCYVCECPRFVEADELPGDPVGRSTMRRVILVLIAVLAIHAS